MQPQLVIWKRFIRSLLGSRTGITGYFGYPAVSGVSFVDMVATSLMVLNANMLAKVNSEI